MKKVVLSILFFTLSNICFSANQTIPDDRKIEKLIVYTNSVIVTFSPSFQALDQSCSSSAKDTIALDTADNANNEIYTAILAAANSKSLVGFGIGECLGQYAKIYRLDASY